MIKSETSIRSILISGDKMQATYCLARVNAPVASFRLRSDRSALRQPTSALTGASAHTGLAVLWLFSVVSLGSQYKLGSFNNFFMLFPRGLWGFLVARLSRAAFLSSNFFPLLFSFLKNVDPKSRHKGGVETCVSSKIGRSGSSSRFFAGRYFGRNTDRALPTLMNKLVPDKPKPFPHSNF